MEKCNECQVKLRPNNKRGYCYDCARKCHCGNKKDHRAKECLSCGMRRKAKLQWKKIRPKMIKAQKQYGAKTRRKYNELKEADFRNSKFDGRLWAHYWKGGKKKTIYRYQWRWIKANGAIPLQMVLHHKDHNNINDDLSNLELMTKSDHARLHAKERKIEFVCQFCDKVFSSTFRYRNGKKNPQKFCKRECGYSYRRKFGKLCETFAPANKRTVAICKKLNLI